MEEVEEARLRLNVPTAAVLIATLLLAIAIPYNALWRQAGSGASSLPSVSSQDPPPGRTRVMVGLNDPQPRTVTLRYDETVEAVQQELAASGIYNGPIDGVLGRRTELAIAAYQRMQGLDPTGVASPELVDHIQLTRQFAAAAEMTGSVDPSPSGDTVRSVQRRLSELGYDPGAENGALGALTQIAIRRFEKDHGMRPTGQLSEALITALDKGDPHAVRASR
jgi:peptidoglycan hydrolase-like protein with peptidoglycan-binding domain